MFQLIWVWMVEEKYMPSDDNILDVIPESNGRKRIEADDPTRCQAVTKNGQCPSAQIEGSEYCMPHGGYAVANRQRAEGLRNYNLTKFFAKQQIANHADSTHIKSLRDEIGILRVMMEERLNGCKDAHDLLLQSGPIADLVMKINSI